MTHCSLRESRVVAGKPHVSRCRCKIRYVSKFTAALRGSPCDMAAFLFRNTIFQVPPVGLRTIVYDLYLRLYEYNTTNKPMPKSHEQEFCILQRVCVCYRPTRGKIQNSIIQSINSMVAYM